MQHETLSDLCHVTQPGPIGYLIRRQGCQRTCQRILGDPSAVLVVSGSLGSGKTVAKVNVAVDISLDFSALAKW